MSKLEHHYIVSMTTTKESIIKHAANFMFKFVELAKSQCMRFRSKFLSPPLTPHFAASVSDFFFNFHLSMMMDSDEVTPTKTTPTLIFLCVMAVVGGFPIGYFTTVISGAMLIIRSQFFLDDQWLQFIVSTTVAAAAIFALVGGWFNQRIGRKKVILVSCLFYIIGCIVTSVATNKEAIVAGRFLHGIAIGLSSCTIPPYLAECVPTNIRGRLLILFPVLIAFGQWVACMFAASLSYLQDKNCSWRIMFAIGGIPVLIKLFGFPFMPESPRWLVSKGYIDEAFKVLKSIYGKTEKGIAMAQMNINSMTETSNAEESRTKKRECTLFKLLRNRASRKALILTFASIVRMGGVKNESTAMWMSAVIAGANFFGTVLGVYLIERLGRRSLVFFSMLGVIVGLLLMGIGFQLISIHAMPGKFVEANPPMVDLCSEFGCDECSYDSNCGFCYDSSANDSQLTGACVSIYKNDSGIVSSEYALYGRCSPKSGYNNVENDKSSNLQFEYGFCSTRLGGVPWAVNAEIYPNWARSTGNSLGTFNNWIFNLLTALTFLTLSKKITRQGVFFMYAGLMTLGLVLLYLLMPETKGVSIDNIESILEGPWIYKKSSNDKHQRRYESEKLSFTSSVALFETNKTVGNVNQVLSNQNGLLKVLHFLKLLLNQFQLPEQLKSQKRRTHPIVIRCSSTLILLSTVAVLGGFPLGYFTAIVSGAMLIIREQFHLNDQWQQLTVSTTVASAAVFSLVGGWLNHKIGRRKVMLNSCLFYIIGGIVTSVANGKEVLIFGRFIHGIAIGLSSCTIPVYLAECVPTNVRGRMLILFPVLITFGQWIACISAASFSYMQDKNSSWRIMYSVGGIPVLFQLMSLPFMPESPRWLISKGRKEEAFKVLKSIYGESDHGIAMAQINVESITETSRTTDPCPENKGFALLKMLKKRTTRKALIVGCALQMFQQLSAVNVVMYYSASIIRMGGVRNETTAIWMSAVTSAANFLGTVLGAYLIERLGRRLLVFLSLTGVIFGLLLMGTGFHLISIHAMPGKFVESNRPATDHCIQFGCDDCSYDPNCGFCFNSAAYHPQLTGTCVSISKNGSEILSTEYALYGRCSKKVNIQNFKSSYNAPNVQFDYGFCTTRYSWIPILAMTSFLCFFSIGLGGIPWTVNAEIYPNWARSCGNSLATFVNWMFNLITAQTFLTLTKQITREGVFFMYSGFTVFGTIILYLMMPETKGVPIDNIETVLEGPWIYKSISTSKLLDNLHRRKSAGFSTEIENKSFLKYCT
ncbi:Proton myo-inositol cotransporter [Trichinella zimbabwensis]|uniref:Proton myo-inositol cotransporter n=1 Tax=Trichinella zimbabwensis TaxID=268475 RepID=A0A0V1I865_9BILA|nr:Proton myo-inositol cotransporter [Trichinella zimbabwensis]